MTTYKLSDVHAQEAILSNQLVMVNPVDRAKAFKSMYKRIDRFYGLNNKYLSNGRIRNK